MKVVIVNTLYYPSIVGGAEKVVQRLAEGLVGAGHEVVVVTTHSGSTPKRDWLNGVDVRYLPLRNFYFPFSNQRPGSVRRALWHVLDSYNPLMARAVGKILDEVAPDVVNLHNLAGFSVAVISTARRRGLPVVHTPHDQYMLCPKSTMFKNERNCEKRCLDCRIYGIPRARASQEVDVLVGVSRFIADRHRQFGYFGNAQNRVVYNAVVQEAAVQRSTETQGTLRFGFLGQLRVSKGLHILVDAFLSSFADRAQLVIAGTGEDAYEARLRARTHGLASVEWLGFVPASELFERIDVLVVPSLWNDTAPLVVLEAFAHGVPVLGSNRGGIPEFISDECGWIFDTGSCDHLITSMQQCIEQRAHLPQMAAAARRAAQEFSGDRFLDGYLDAYSAAQRTMHVTCLEGRD